MAGPTGPHYACRCLNIRIRPAACPTTPANLEDPNFTPVFVEDDGISVEHTQATVRTRTRGKPIAGTSTFSRYTTITCLLCDLLVYRVYQTYPADVDGKEGPLLPTEDWVERDIMRSINGWIEVHKECLGRQAIDEALSSPTYSSSFSLLLPKELSSSPSIEPIFERPPSQSSDTAPAPAPPMYFANLRPVFLPPPFTPSHPVFGYFASLAANQSQAVRVAAEDYMNEQLKMKIMEIEKADANLRRDVEGLWKKFLDGVGLIQQRRDQSLSSRSRERAVNGLGSSLSPIPIRDFSPTIVPPAAFSSPSLPRVSALSASLATSTFHHRRGSSSRSSPSPPGRSASVLSTDSAEALSNAETLTALPRSPTGSNVLRYRRNLQETVDYATSYKYFVDLEKDMSRLRGRQPNPEQVAEQQNEQNGTSHAIADTTGSDSTTTKPQPSGVENQHVPNHEPDSPQARGREKASLKGKRVTFDVPVTVVAIETEVSEDKDDAQNQREMIFDFEENEEEGSQHTLTFSRPTLQPAEQSAMPVRPRRQRPSGSSSLSSSFSGLRPASLPPPSNIRPPRSPHGSDSSIPSMMLPLPRVSMISKGRQYSRPDIGVTVVRHGDRADKEHAKDAEAGRLTPTNSPGNRGSWKSSDSKAWQTFVRRQGKSRQRDEKIPEEGENDDDNGSGVASGQRNRRSVTTEDEEHVNGDRAMFVGSLPIPIQLRRPPPALSLASYQPKTLGTQMEPDVDGLVSPARKPISPTAIRKAVYAERDRLRSMDPGTLDFAAEEDKEDNEAAINDALPDGTGAGGRGRTRALKILQSQSEIPEAGMWRSLAS